MENFRIAAKVLCTAHSLLDILTALPDSEWKQAAIERAQKTMLLTAMFINSLSLK